MTVGQSRSAAVVAVIDLGVLRDGSELPVYSLAGRPRRRRVVAVLSAAAVVLATAVAASPVRAALVERTFPGVPARSDQPVVADTTDGVYLVRANGPQVGPGERTITRYGGAHAEQVWRVTVMTTGAVNGADVVDGTLLVLADGWETQTIALNAADGRELWRRTGWWRAAGSGQLLLSYRPPGKDVDVYQGVALATGAVRWSVSVPANDWVLPDRSHLVRWSVDRRVEVRDLRTGAVVSRGTLPPTGNATGRVSEPGVQVAGGLLLVAGWQGERPVATAYGLSHLDRRWQADIDLSSEAVHGCGAQLCVSGRNGQGGVRMLEQDTGRTRWADHQRDNLAYTGSTLLAFGPRNGPPQIVVVDPATGKPIGNLGRWQTPPTIAPDGTMLGVRTDPASSRSWIAELDPAARTTRVLGVADNAFACHAGPSAITCRRTDGTIGVWFPRHRIGSTDPA
jgi:outer membrane protein assembly factor BamB